MELKPVGPTITSIVAVDANDVEVALPSTNVAANSTYEVAFSAAVDSATVTTSTIFLTQDGIKQLATVSYSADDKTATLTPNDDTLAPGKEYVLTVNGVKDAAAVAVPVSTTNFTNTRGRLNTRGRFYCALCWLKNTEESVWKRFCWWWTQHKGTVLLCTLLAEKY